MSKIYLFLLDFKELVKSTDTLPESIGFNHPVTYYEDLGKSIIYFYKPIGSFVYCYSEFVQVPTESEGEEKAVITGITPEQANELKQEFNAIEVPRKLYVSHVELNGVISQ